jgi:hypothetical protein
VPDDQAWRERQPLELTIRAPDVSPVSVGADSALETQPRWTALVIAVVVGVCAVLGYLSTLIA